jgi:hypothetical protein
MSDPFMAGRAREHQDGRSRIHVVLADHAARVLRDPGDGARYRYSVVVRRDYRDGTHGRDAMFVYWSADAAAAKYRELVGGDTLWGERVTVGAYRSRSGG